jgi:hypothetical protein
MNKAERAKIERILRARLAAQGFDMGRMRQYETTTAIARGVQAGVISQWERREPVNRQRSLISDYVVPLLQAVTTGFFIGLGAGFVIGSWSGGVGTGLVVTTGFWLLRQFDDRRLLWKIERIVGRDLDQDHHVGEPELEPEPSQPTARTVQIEHTNRKRNLYRLRFSELPDWLTDERLVPLAHALLVKQTKFSRRKLKEVISQDEYPNLVEAFLTERFVFEVGKGYELTGSGARFLRHFLNDTV